MYRSKKGTRFARVKDVPIALSREATAHAKPPLGAAPQKKN
jgi:hypothetical protein